MVNLNNLEIFIQRDFHSNSVEIWLRERGLNENVNISYDGQNLIGTTLKFDEAPKDDLKPFLKLPSDFSFALFKAISEYNSKEGIKTPDENLLVGKLKATEEHLNDMREFSKKLLDASLNAR